MRVCKSAAAIMVCGVAALAFLAAPDATRSGVLSVGDDLYPIEWLDKPITLEAAERAYMPPRDDRSDPAPRKPFGFNNAQWEELKAHMQPGDELWTFSSPADSWQHLAGRAGVALVRNKKVVGAIVTLMN